MSWDEAENITQMLGMIAERGLDYRTTLLPKFIIVQAIVDKLIYDTLKELAKKNRDTMYLYDEPEETKDEK